MTAFPSRWRASNYASAPNAASVTIPSAPGCIVVVDGIVASMFNFSGAAQKGSYDIHALINGVTIYLGTAVMDGTSIPETSSVEVAGLELVGCTIVSATAGVTGVDESLQVTGYVL